MLWHYITTAPPPPAPPFPTRSTQDVKMSKRTKLSGAQGRKKRKEEEEKRDKDRGNVTWNYLSVTERDITQLFNIKLHDLLIANQ